MLVRVHYHAWGNVCLVGLLALTGCPQTEPPARSQKVETSPMRRESLPTLARSLLCARMQRHAEEMNTLMGSVTMLDWDGVQRSSTALLDEPTVAAPLPGSEDDSLNARMPASFFAHQEALLESLRALRAAARLRDDHEMKVAFNGVTAACIDCHADFLLEDEQPSFFERNAARECD